MQQFRNRDNKSWRSLNVKNLVHGYRTHEINSMLICNVDISYFYFFIYNIFWCIIVCLCYQSQPRLSGRDKVLHIYVACGIDIRLVRSRDTSAHALCQPRGYRIYTRIVVRPAPLSSRVQVFRVVESVSVI